MSGPAGEEVREANQSGGAPLAAASLAGTPRTRALEQAVLEGGAALLSALCFAAEIEDWSEEENSLLVTLCRPLLVERSERLRVEAASLLLRIGEPWTAVALPELRARALDTDAPGGDRVVALQLLGEMHSRAEEAYAVLRRLLKGAPRIQGGPPVLERLSANALVALVRLFPALPPERQREFLEEAMERRDHHRTTRREFEALASLEPAYQREDFRSWMLSGLVVGQVDLCRVLPHTSPEESAYALQVWLCGAGQEPPAQARKEEEIVQQLAARGERDFLPSLLPRLLASDASAVRLFAIQRLVPLLAVTPLSPVPAGRTR